MYTTEFFVCDFHVGWFFSILNCVSAITYITKFDNKLAVSKFAADILYNCTWKLTTQICPLKMRFTVVSIQLRKIEMLPTDFKRKLSDCHSRVVCQDLVWFVYIFEYHWRIWKSYHHNMFIHSIIVNTYIWIRYINNNVIYSNCYYAHVTRHVLWVDIWLMFKCWQPKYWESRMITK